MKKLNPNSTRIFCTLLERIEDTEEHIRLESEGFMPLVIEIIDNNIDTPFGPGKIVSLCHYYKQNGDMMRDPEMCFIVVDNRQDKQDFQMVGIYPQMFQQDSLSVYEESILIENRKVISFKPLWQSGHTRFANGWLQNIRHLGFLK